jgi:hypothetical protein
MPSPPYPSPENVLLQAVIGNAIGAAERGEADWKEAVLHAGVHGWHEGRIEGEDVRLGCGFRGQLPKGSARG